MRQVVPKIKSCLEISILLNKLIKYVIQIKTIHHHQLHHKDDLISIQFS